jgi:hypothetical protein
MDACAVDLPKRTAPYPGIGIPELRGVEGVVKFGPELKVMPFSYRCVFDERNVPVKLPGTDSLNFEPIF